MLYPIVHFLVAGLAVLATAKIVPGFKIDGFGTACLAALLIGLANVFVWPLLIFLTLPINILTLGLFTFVINGAIIKLCAALLPGFAVNSWLSAIIGAIVLSLLAMLLHALLA